jgi:integrase
MRQIIDGEPDGKQQTLYWLAAETGMGAGELCGLQWQDVKQGCLDVVRSVCRGPKQSVKNTDFGTQFCYLARASRASGECAGAIWIRVPLEARHAVYCERRSEAAPSLVFHALQAQRTMKRCGAERACARGQGPLWFEFAAGGWRGCLALELQEPAV